MAEDLAYNKFKKEANDSFVQQRVLEQHLDNFFAKQNNEQDKTAY